MATREELKPLFQMIVDAHGHISNIGKGYFAILAEDLEPYEPELIREALKRHRRISKFAPSSSELLELIDRVIRERPVAPVPVIPPTSNTIRMDLGVPGVQSLQRLPEAELREFAELFLVMLPNQFNNNVTEMLDAIAAISDMHPDDKTVLRSLCEHRLDTAITEIGDKDASRRSRRPRNAKVAGSR